MQLDVQPSAIDRLVSWFSPRAGVQRLYHRHQLAVARASYEGASRGRRTAGWRTPSTSGTTAASGQLSTLRDRSRDLTRNNGWAAHAIEVIENNVVGRGIQPRILADNEALQKRVRAAWKRWAVDSSECDAHGCGSFYDLQALVMRTVAESGECLVRRRPRRREDGLSVPLQLEVLEPDYLDTTRWQPQPGTNGHRIIDGIELDALGRVAGYWLYREHPGDAGVFGSHESRFVPASEILHIFQRQRAGQLRGVPFPHAAIIRLRDLDEVYDVQLVRIKIAACFAALVHDIDASRLGEGADEEAEREKVEPGMLWHLPPGKNVTFGSPPQVGDFPAFSVQVLRGIAAAYGITYEQLSGDYSGVNFSSGRMGWIEASRTVARRTGTLKMQLCVPVWSWFEEALWLSEGIDIEAVAASWEAPRREMLDPVKETEALKTQVRSGFRTLSDAIRDQGRDPQEALDELADDMAMLDELGLVLDTDPRKGSGSGASAPRPREEDEKAENRVTHALNGAGV